MGACAKAGDATQAPEHYGLKRTGTIGPGTAGTVAPPYIAKTTVDLERATKALDKLRNKVEEWGVVSISEPVAVLDGDVFYIPSDIISPDKALKDAQTDRDATSSQFISNNFNNSLSGSASPIGTTAAGGATATPTSPKTATSKTTSKTVTTGTTHSESTSTPALSTPGDTDPRPSDPSGSDSNTSDPATPASSPTAKGGDTTAAAKETGTNAAGGAAAAKQATTTSTNATETDTSTDTATSGPIQLPAPQISDGPALQEAYHTLDTENITAMMHCPASVKGYSNVIFAIVEVSCNPGWRTQEHYIGDCSASAEYFDMVTMTHLSRAELRAPTVFSVLPLMDAQTVEMANSTRDVTQLAFNLAASLPAHGMNVSVNDILKFVRTYAKDVRSVTPIPVVNSYSSGGTFGFRFSPSFQAQRNPAEKNSRAANVLLPTTFPALITFVLHDRDLDFIYNNFHPQELALMMHISTRWYLKDRPPLWQVTNRLFSPMKRDTAEMEVNAAGDVATVEKSKKAFEDATGTADEDVYNPQQQELRREIIALDVKGVGHDWPIPLPAFKPSEPYDPEPGSLIPPGVMNDEKTRIQALQKQADDARKALEQSQAATPGDQSTASPTGKDSSVPAASPAPAGRAKGAMISAPVNSRIASVANSVPLGSDEAAEELPTK